MSNEVSPESPPAYDSIPKDGSGIPIAGEVVPQTQQQQEYAEYCAQQNTQQPVVVNQLPEGAVIVEQQPQVVVMQQVGPNYCHFCKQHVSTRQTIKIANINNYHALEEAFWLSLSSVLQK